MVEVEELFEISIDWTVKDAAARLLCAEVAGKEYILRINDFPDEPAYTLIADGEEALDFDDFPDHWTHPSLRR